MSSKRWLAAVFLAAVAVTACGDDDDDKKCNIEACSTCLSELKDNEEFSKCDKPCDKCPGVED